MREIEIIAQPQPPQEALVCDHAGRVINKSSRAGQSLKDAALGGGPGQRRSRRKRRARSPCPSTPPCVELNMSNWSMYVLLWSTHVVINMSYWSIYVVLLVNICCTGQSIETWTATKPSKETRTMTVAVNPTGEKYINKW